ncbi:Cu(I)-responsive transcriptional regulator [Enterobacter ludwigii]|nr:Cu(I)-responsive transcriptional regulator [Escherichia coli]EKS6730698.1 Cu(I)-responsive transcriptional regulator [Enterobacter mori]MBX8911066.1 Cu(I)-responsive transcriptional regulator [Enterobacter ludwigii]
MNIGNAAKSAGVSAKMIRYYEQIGLIPEAKRTDTGYRTFSASDINSLQFIRRCRELGFSLTEIQGLLEMWRNESRHSADVKKIVQSQIEDLEQRIYNLQQMTETLKSMMGSCPGNDNPACPILNRLSINNNKHGEID